MGLADGNILDWCPAINLLAISMNKTSIWVYRLNGERIYSLNNKSPITSISFMDNGAFFCLAGLDGLIKIYDSNNGSLIKILDKTFIKVNLIKFNYHANISNTHVMFQIDILSKLPRLSLDNTADDLAVSPVVLPSDINELNNVNNLNFLIVIDDMNNVAINFNNLLTIEDVKLPTKGGFVDYFDNKNNLFNQLFLVSNEKYELVQMRLNIKEMNQKYYLGIILRYCKIISILGYLRSQLGVLKMEISPFLVLYDRYLVNLGEALDETDENMQSQTQPLKEFIQTCLYDLILTNLIPERLKDFWLNQFGERSYKKLLRLGTSIYDNIRNLVFTKIIACLERLLILLNELRGLSIWFKDSQNELTCLDLSAIDQMISTAKSFLKSSYKLIWDVNEEKRLFTMFLNWIKFEIIDKLSKEDDLNSYLTGPQQGFKHSDLFKYVNGALLHSSLFKYFDLDLGANSILVQHEQPEVDLPRMNFELNATFNDSIVAPFKGFTKEVLQFENLSIQLDLFKDIKLNYFENNSILASWNAGNLSLIKFNTLTNLLTKVLIQFQKGIDVIFEFKDSKELIVLMTSEEKYQLESFNFLDLLNGDNLLEYDMLKKTGILTQDEIGLKNPKKMTITRGSDKKHFGCLLDGNRQNYVIFDLH